MRIGIGIGEIANQPASIGEVIEQARRAEADGFASAWVAHIMALDALTLVALCGRETSKIELGTAVVPTFPRHPGVMAQQALSAQAACDGRFSLGIGLSHQIVIENMFGLSWQKPYSHMKAYMEVLAPLIRDGSAAVDNGEYRVNLNLNVPGSKPCPILIAALAPKMLGLAGTAGDGTITWMTGPKTLREHTVPCITEAAAAAGRPAPRVIAGLPISVTEDPDAAREKAAHVFQMYGFLPSYRAMLDREGAAGPGDVAIAGDEDDVNAQLDRLAEIGVTDFLAIPYGSGADRQASAARTHGLLVARARA